MTHRTVFMALTVDRSGAFPPLGRDGVSAPLSAVAAEAGVGIATLYRRFPERDALVQ